jgi:hypothetical protein
LDESPAETAKKELRRKALTKNESEFGKCIDGDTISPGKFYSSKRSRLSSELAKEFRDMKKSFKNVPTEESIIC